jgi:hypothetical protein
MKPAAVAEAVSTGDVAADGDLILAAATAPTNGTGTLASVRKAPSWDWPASVPAEVAEMVASPVVVGTARHTGEDLELVEAGYIGTVVFCGVPGQPPTSSTGSSSGLL